MRFEHSATLPMTPLEAFERLRHYERLYPYFHSAHEASPREPELLSPNSRFVVSERIGLERREYRIRVTRYEPATSLTLEADVVTRYGPLRIPSRLAIAFEIASRPGGCLLTVRQTVTFNSAWLAWLMTPRWLWRGVERHADEEFETAIALLAAPQHFPPAASA
ncbi:MAG TPA: hypothetical protein V6D47_02865 [Oscillatoriaceae cyanobacterium]